MNVKKIKTTLLIAVLILSPIFAVMAMADLPEGFMLGVKNEAYSQWDDYMHYVGQYSVLLETYGDPGSGDEARIVIPMPEGFTLGDLNSISWEYYLVTGYAPHVDIMVDTNGDGVIDDALVVEYAYNDADSTTSHGLGLTGAWYTTFSDDGNGPAAVTDTAMAWATTGAPGPLDMTDTNFIYHSLAEWKTGVTYTLGAVTKTINEYTPVLALEFEVDNWIVQTEAYIDNIEINGDVYDLEFEEGEPIDTIVTGTGEISSPDANATVYYDGADNVAITIEDLEEDDVEESTFGAVGEYFDVKIDDPTAVDGLEIMFHYDDADILAAGLDEEQLVMYWYDGTDWSACSDYWVNTVDNILSAWVDDTTIPSLSNLTGTQFGPGGGMVIDAEYYNSFDIVSVMLGDTEQNTDPEVAEVASVYVWSDTDFVLGSTIALMETGVDTGVFAGTFNLVEDSPGAGELLVSTGDFFYVEYYGCDPSWKYFDDWAIIDDIAPVVEITEIDGVLVTDVAFSDFVTGVFDITADIDEEWIFDLLVTGDLSLIAAELTDQTSGTFDIEWDTEAKVLTVPLWPDDTYSVTVTATDGADNTGADSIILTVDNTGPIVTNPLVSPLIIGESVSSTIVLTATVVDAGIGVDTVTVDCSSIGEGTVDLVQVGTTDVYKATVIGVDVDTEDTYELPISALDLLGNENSLAFITLEVIDDTDGPTGLTVTDVEPICGGLIIKGLYADDALTGVVSYDILMNGTTWMDVSEEDLTATTWTSGAVVLNRMVVLAGNAGEYVNVTVIAYDQATNPSDEIIIYEGMIPEGEWSPVRLYTGWNLVSLPLIPDSSDREDVLSLILDQGASGIVVSYGYDQYLDIWIPNPAEITDGYGYWLYALDDDVMIVEGIDRLPAPLPPATYEFTSGWVLAGYKATYPMTIEEYTDSLADNSYFSTVYIWNAETPAWNTLDTTADSLDPGQGFWIWMYADQDLIPPMD